MIDKISIKERLLKKYPPDVNGTWILRGEDDNADLCGPHDMPKLGKFIGTYPQAIDYALSLPRFVTWGAGGTIEPSYQTSIEIQNKSK